jgi:TonB-dependent receptor
VNIAKSYVLPAATFTWNFADDLQLRLGYSQTIARPQFRELAFTPFIDPDTDRTYEGNPFLTDSEFKNYDARLEYYFGRGQFVTGAVFYKTIENPIEEVIVPAQSGATITRFLNAPEATLYGVEVEFRTTFEMPFEAPFLVEPTWLFNINYTYTSSEVTAGSGSTVVSPIDFRRVAASQFGLDGSELQGTPEHIVNLQFGYETDMSQLTLIAGYVSERIAQRGLGALPTVFDEPGVNLDLVLRQDFEVFGTLLTFGASGRNLLGTDFQEYQVSRLGRTDYNTYARGRSFSLSVTAKW